MPAGKVQFVVVHKSSEDAIYPSSELNNHGPTIKGWRSSKNCEYPQQLVLKLYETTVIHQIQILAHQYLIPSKIEIWIGPEEHTDTDNLTNLNYEYLGYITLNDNDGGLVKSRELKTITLPLASATSYVKLILYENHKNSLNRSNQVSLIGIQVTGEKHHTDHQENVSHHSSIYDDLAFEMYVDKGIAEIIRMLENRKITAVEDERFEYARKLKCAMTELRSAGEKLGKLELSKTQAIQIEDYGKAKKKKTQMEEYRTQVLLENRIDDLLEKNGPLEINDEEPEDFVDKTPGSVDETVKYARSLSPIVSPKEVSVKPCQQEIQPEKTETEVPDEPDVYHSPVSPLHYPENNSRERSPKLQHTIVTKAISLKRPKPIRPKSNKNSYEAYDEQAIPAQRFCQTQTTNLQDSSTLPSASGVGASKLNERDKKQASIPIAVFGLPMVKHFFSKQYSDKVEGLKLMEASMKNFMFDGIDVRHSPNKMTRAAVQLLHRTLRDKVFAVYNLSAEIIRFLFSEFVPGRVTTGEASRSIETLLPELLAKAGDTTPRIHNIATHTILSVAEVPDIRKLNIIPTHLTRLLTGNIHPRLILSRLEMVEQLIISQGVSSDKNSGMTCRTLCEFGMSAIHHPTEAVRKAAERILIHVYKVNPRFVRKQLPPDDEITRRNIMYRQLMQEFERVDQERQDELDNAGPTTQCKLVRSTSENTSYHNNDSAHDITSNVHNKLSSSTSASITDVYENGQNNISAPKLNRCTFCKEESNFSEEELNIHYWKYCPLLMRCEQCSEVIEIMGLRHHLIKDCDFRDKYKTCDLCLEVVEIEFLEHHILGPTCKKRNAITDICPLCLDTIGNELQDWNKHLVIPSACKNHPRKNYLKRN
ncbi:Armadillo-type fold,TOG domain,Armadillo-like helical,Galactose-binding domain-like [Cinara cedri]|uniref:Armadillo-type fold,TOG domain,Armadillo-like helical,Galactose-binding domain-like n=1 Tax=Cinara cedri TaxID=506608 RepID=A0A5E4MYG3_9HEMI|nr:Armadillo-type fold,TOG domain,Armadillo-like helical,Galactose-binding domain-like [Cinara cedri]